MLAPMEGVVDWATRDLFSKLGGVDICVTEFIRITNQLLPAEVFYRYAPELKQGSKTASGTPMLVQLLGGDAQALAENAAQACQLGAYGIDLNFGCPAKTVNRHDGGAALLKCPDRIFKIVSAVRAAVPKHISVSAKIRLGFDDPNACLENSKAVHAAGADWLTVHCRTKTDMYKPPAYWEWIPKIREVAPISIVANGEIWSVKDYFQCKKISGSNHLMIGRGALADPFIFLKIKALLSANNPDSSLVKSQEAPSETVTAKDSENLTYVELKPLLQSFYLSSANYRTPAYAVARTKQWLRQLSLRHQELLLPFEQLKVLDERSGFQKQLFS
jgi:tRNA-dihydrouridine synthase C